MLTPRCRCPRRAEFRLPRTRGWTAKDHTANGALLYFPLGFMLIDPDPMKILSFIYAFISSYFFFLWDRWMNVVYHLFGSNPVRHLGSDNLPQIQGINQTLVPVSLHSNFGFERDISNLRNLRTFLESPHASILYFSKQISILWQKSTTQKPSITEVHSKQLSTEPVSMVITGLAFSSFISIFMIITSSLSW